MPIRASSASRVRTAVRRSSSSGVVAAFSTPASWDSPNQPPASSASASTTCSRGAAWATARSASLNASGLEIASIAASICSSE